MRYTICITTRTGYRHFTSRFEYEAVCAMMVEAMATSPNGSAKVTLLLGTKATGDVVARWYPKSMRDGEPRWWAAEAVADKLRKALKDVRREIEADRGR